MIVLVSPDSDEKQSEHRRCSHVGFAILHRPSDSGSTLYLPSSKPSNSTCTFEFVTTTKERSRTGVRVKIHPITGVGINLVRVVIDLYFIIFD